MNTRVSLSVIKGPGRGTSWVFEQPGRFLIGRGDDADYQLSADDPYASRKHAFLEIVPPACSLLNLSRTNPSRVNDKVVTEQQLLKDGDLVDLGMARIAIAIATVDGEAQEKHESPAEVKREASADQSAKALASCHRCGEDVTKHANSDGRAADLAGAAIYCCAKCLPPRNKAAADSFAGNRLLKCLGEGAFGRVYLVWHPETWRLAAAKHIRDLPHEAALRFEREISILGQLKSRNVVRYYGSGQWDGKPYIAAEYLPSGDLESLKSRTKIDVGTAVLLVISLLDGLRELHSRGIVHRDIKPPNVLVREGDPEARFRWSAVIADFGLARSYAAAGGLVLTRPNAALGTYLYMPPEQVRSAHDVTPTADLYAAGVILYYLLTSRYPFDFPTPGDVEEVMHRFGRIANRADALRMLLDERKLRHPLQLILEEDPIPVAERNARIPAKLCQIVDRAVAKQSRARFQTADEMQLHLRAFLRDGTARSEQA